MLFRSVLSKPSAVLQKYSAAAVSYLYGLTTTNGATVGYSGSGTLAAGDVAYFLKWNVSPGARTIKQVSCRISLDGTGNCTGGRLAIYSQTGNTLIREAQTRLFDGAGSGTTREVIWTVNLPITVVAGKTYWIALILEVPDGHANGAPLIRSTNDGTADAGHTKIGYFTGGLGATTTADGTGWAAYSNRTSFPVIQVKYDSDQYLEYDSGDSFYSGTDRGILIPIAETESTFIKAEDVAVPDAHTLSILYRDSESTGGDGLQEKQTCIVDMGATDRMTYGGQNVNLPAIDGAAQAGHTFDLGTIVTGPTNSPRTRTRFVWLNKTRGAGPKTTAAGNGYYRDIATISHAAANTGAYGNEYSHTPGYAIWVTKSGASNPTIGRLIVGIRPFVLMGDSQTGVKNGDAVNATLTRLGAALPGAFTKKRIWWDAGISGGCVTVNDANYSTGDSTALTLRFKASTPGQGDLCEMKGSVFILNGVGLNEIVDGTTEDTRAGAVASALSGIAYIVSEIKKNGDRAVIIGLPPYLDPAADAVDHDAPRMLNRGLMGLALATGVPFANPYRVAIIDSDNIHYSTAGATAAAAWAAQRIENNKIDVIDSNLF